MVFPLAGVPYYIQSADTSDYLCLRNIDQKYVTMRSLKADEALQQQWKFVDYDEDHRTHRIVNVATQDSNYPRYLTTNSDPNDKLMVALTRDIDESNNNDSDNDDEDFENDLKSWRVIGAKEKGLFAISCPTGTGRAKMDVFLVVNRHEKVRIPISVPLVLKFFTGGLD
ncbi:hypothetical protein BGW80DRAFT_1342453 [Lactifluus volemus]|nr:hypothetical protein BGW80DRAFT_1342453 [Lactifluus volemus]